MPKLLVFCFLISAVLLPAAENESNEPILPELPKSPMIDPSTVPATGDLNPYGVAFVPALFPFGGSVSPGDVLISNFNAASNFQGTGTTIVSISPNGKQHLFFQGPKGLGLTTALGVLERGMVLVGNVPTTDGSCSTITTSGSLLVLDRHGHQAKALTDSKLLDGPWDLTIFEDGFHSIVFVSNVLSGSVTRLDVSVSLDGSQLNVLHETQIASGYGHRCDSNALVVGPTGLAYDPQKHLLYVASTEDNAIYSIKDADDADSDHGKGSLVYQDNAHLRGPVGLVLAPNGNLIATNGDAINGDPAHPSEMIEFTPSGHFAAALTVDSGGQGGAFGIAVSGPPGATRFAAVDDVNNSLKLWFVQ